MTSKEVSKKGKGLVSGKQVYKKSEKQMENQRFSQDIANQSKTACPLCHESYDGNWKMQDLGP
ncbi:hypothetical protein WA026_019725 [Henosepilachna vigintioctopunctata]|uniref:Cytochrome C n=1 Tax=Henosepilachna vigintioctopunctata TaxID=420089 RepID=A0AAW1UQF5_9CUCU